MKTMRGKAAGQLGFSDLDKRLEVISAKADPLAVHPARWDGGRSC